jgi:membrane protease YdiL (CAAX protease family)
MNEYADLFQPDRKPTQPNANDPRDPLEVYEEAAKDRRHNKWAFLLYFLVYIVLIGAMGFYFASLYPDPQATLANIATVQSPTFVDQGPLEGSSDRLVVFTATLQNQNVETVESLQLLITFVDDAGEVLFETTLSKDRFLSQEVWEIEESFAFSTVPADVSVQGTLYVSTLTNVLFSAAQGVVLIVLFFAMQWKGLAEQGKRFFRNWKRNLSTIVIGVALVYAAVIAGNYLLQLFGVSETSQNEMAIQSMFQDDPLILWLLFFTLCVAAPITEEIVFRKAIFGFVEPKWGLAPAILVSALVFGMMHVLGGGDWIQIIPYALMGGAFGYIYHVSGKNLWVVIVMHFVNNFIVFLLYLPVVQAFLQSTGAY